jgi:GTPase SAR1 family protein
MTQIDTNAPIDVNKILLATKSDLESERAVTIEEGMALARKFGIPFVEVSAKTSTNVNDGFEMLVKEIHKKYDQKGEYEGIMSRR